MIFTQVEHLLKDLFCLLTVVNLNFKFDFYLNIGFKMWKPSRQLTKLEKQRKQRENDERIQFGNKTNSEQTQTSSAASKLLEKMKSFK